MCNNVCVIWISGEMSKEQKKTDAAWFWWRYRVEQGYYSVRGIVEVRKEGKGGGLEGSQGDTEGPHARTAHRYAITWLQPDVICMRVSPLRHDAGRKKKGKGKGAYSLPCFHLGVLPSSRRSILHWFKESTRRRSRFVSFFSPFFYFSSLLPSFPYISCG